MADITNPTTPPETPVLPTGGATESGSEPGAQLLQEMTTKVDEIERAKGGVKPFAEALEQCAALTEKIQSMLATMQTTDKPEVANVYAKIVPAVQQEVDALRATGEERVARVAELQGQLETMIMELKKIDPSLNL